MRANFRGRAAAGMGMEDAYRAPSVSRDQYEDSGSRFSDAGSFRAAAGGSRWPWRSALATAFLFCLGTSFLIIGGVHFWHSDQGAAIAFFVVGSIAFIPGAYAAYYLVQALRGVPGFRVEEIAHWDDYRW